MIDMRLVTPEEYRGPVGWCQMQTRHYLLNAATVVGFSAWEARDQAPELCVALYRPEPCPDLGWLWQFPETLAEALDIAAELAEQRP